MVMKSEKFYHSEAQQSVMLYKMEYIFIIFNVEDTSIILCNISLLH